MPKTRYRYNPRTLSYEEVEIGWLKRLFQIVLIISPSLVLGLIFGFVLFRQFDTPQDRERKEELEKLRSEVERMQLDIERSKRALSDLEAKDSSLYRVAFYADEFPEEMRQMGTGGSDKYAYLDDYPNSELLKKTSSGIDALERRISAQSMSFSELLELARNKEQLLRSIPAIQPVNNKDLKRMASGYGWRVDPIYKTMRMHTGMDFTSDVGTEVYVTGDGVVEEVENNDWGYGKSIIVNHGFGYKTRYAHLSAFKVKKGQKVQRGDLIGLVGSTGKSTGPHLHYEVVKNGEKVNPIYYYHSDLTPEEYEKLVEMSHTSLRALD